MAVLSSRAIKIGFLPQVAQVSLLRPGFGFERFAGLLAVQFSIPAAERPNVPARAGGSPIPVLDKTGLQGTYEFSVDLGPELGTDMLTAWKRALREQLGLKIESEKGEVAVVVVDDVTKIPSEN